MSSQLPVALTFDVENDYFDPHISPAGRDAIAFRGVEEGLPAILNLLTEFEQMESQALPCTWFVRCDDQFARLLGNAGFLLDDYRSTWKQVGLRGHEIGLHCHLYTERNGEWVAARDPRGQQEQIRRVAACFKQRGLAPVCSRMGEGVCSNEIMEVLEEIGIVCDSTAMPGRVRNDEHRRFDWGTTPPHFYHPSREDYRVPGKPESPVLEVPMSMVSIRTPYDAAPLLRYVDLSFHHRLLRDGLLQIVAGAEYLLTVMHPSTILKGLVDRPHGLLSFDLETARANLAFLFRAASDAGRTLKFVTLTDLAAFLCARHK